MTLTVPPGSDGHTESSVDLLLKAQSGDSEALEILLERYLPRLQRWASGRLPANARTMRDTGDVVQEAVIAALGHINTLEIRTEWALQAYLRTAVVNRIKDLCRAKLRRPIREELQENVASKAKSSLDDLIDEEKFELYEKALATLREDDRYGVILKVEFGMSDDEIAELLEKPSAAAARMAVKRAIERLAEQMNKSR